MPRFTLKMNIFLPMSLGTPEMCVETHQNRDHFSETIDLRCHMPRFSLKNEHFPTYLLGNTINVC